MTEVPVPSGGQGVMEEVPGPSGALRGSDHAPGPSGARILTNALNVAVTPGGTMRVLEGGTLVDVTDPGRLQVWRPATTPRLATPTLSPPTSPRGRRLIMDEEFSTDEDGVYDDSDGSDDAGEDGSGDDCGASDLHLNLQNAAFENIGAAARILREEVSLAEDRMMERMGNLERFETGDEVEEGQDVVMRPAEQGLSDFSWSDDFSTFSGQEETYLREPGPQASYQDPVDVFMAIWDREIMDVIVRETNEYAWQTIALVAEAGTIPRALESWKEVTVDELYRFFAIMMVMSLWPAGRVTAYWEKKGTVYLENVNKIMSRDRFQIIHRFLHFVNNYTIPVQRSNYDEKIVKIRPILDHCNAKFAAMYTPMKHLSLDESLLLWKGRLSWKQFIRTKAARFGIKSFDLCEAETGYLLRTQLYAGKWSPMVVEAVPEVQQSSSKIVLELMDGYLNVGHCLVMDNWYNHLPLTRYLKRHGTDVVGTLNRGRLHLPPEIKNANINRMARGDIIARHCGDITLILWQDVKPFTTMSTFHNNETVASRRAGQPVQKPVLVQYYNKYMGGVDSKDQKLSAYLFERKRGKKWYLKVFKRLMNTSLLNAYIIYLKNPMHRVSSHYDFRSAVLEGLIGRFSAPSVQRTPSLPAPSGSRDEVRLQGRDHWPILTDRASSRGTRRRQLRCVRCSLAGRRTDVTTMCRRCRVALCLGACFVEYHSLPSLQ